jgi:uncharacterized protein (TIGR00304 family)
MMRPLRILAAFVILAGVALLIYGVAIGEMQVALLLIVPVIFGSSILGILAIGLIIAGVFVAIADSFLSAERKSSQDRLSNESGLTETPKRKEFGGVVLIGPIPIVFGSSKRMALLAAVIAVIILVLMILSFFFSSG